MYLANASASDGAVIRYNVFTLNNQPGLNGGARHSLTAGSRESASERDDRFELLLPQPRRHRHHGHGSRDLARGLSAIVPTNINITNNTFEGNGKALAINCTNLTITGNTITDSQDVNSGALRFEGGVGNVTIQNNNVYYNPPAMRLDSAASQDNSLHDHE